MAQRNGVQRKWHKEIKAWADGAEIEHRRMNSDCSWSEWTVSSRPAWYPNGGDEYRIKVEPVTTVEYFQKRSFMGKTCYIAFDPDLEHWDLKITYIDDVIDKVELPK